MQHFIGYSKRGLSKARESTLPLLFACIANVRVNIAGEHILVFSSLFSDLFHRKKLDTVTCIITAILGYNNQKKNLNTFNKIKTFKYSKIFA